MKTRSIWPTLRNIALLTTTFAALATAAEQPSGGPQPGIACSIDRLNLFQVLNTNACGLAKRNALSLEYRGSYSDAFGNAPPTVSLRDFRGSDAEILAEIVRQSPGYRLTTSDGVTSIAPKVEARKPIGAQLDRQLDAYSSLNSGLSTAFNRLIHKAKLNGIRITSPANESARSKKKTLTDYLPANDSDSDSSAKKVNLTVQGKPSIRQVLDALVRADAPAFWSAFMKGDEVFVILQPTSAKGASVPTLPANEVPLIHTSTSTSDRRNLKGVGF